MGTGNQHINTPVVALEDSIRKGQVNKETVLTVFFDIEKAYDMVWREGLLRQMGIKGRMFQWVKDFLSGRRITVKINEELSSEYTVGGGGRGGVGGTVPARGLSYFHPC